MDIFLLHCDACPALRRALRRLPPQSAFSRRLSSVCRALHKERLCRAAPFGYENRLRCAKKPVPSVRRSRPARLAKRAGRAERLRQSACEQARAPWPWGPRRASGGVRLRHGVRGGACPSAGVRVQFGAVGKASISADEGYFLCSALRLMRSWRARKAESASGDGAGEADGAGGV